MPAPNPVQFSEAVTVLPWEWEAHLPSKGNAAAASMGLLRITPPLEEAQV